MFDSLKKHGFEISTHHHAEAILTHDMPDAVAELEAVLSKIKLPAEELIRSGGGEGQLTQRLRRELAIQYGWRKHNFEVKKIVDGQEKESISHEIDHVKTFAGGTFALEIEWNNKDPFFDRDLENFKRLHADGVISVGGIVTRGTSLQSEMRAIVRKFALQEGIDSMDELSKFNLVPTGRQRDLISQAVNLEGEFAAGWARIFVSDKFGMATTHWSQLELRVHRGVGNPCPLLLIGIPSSVVTF